MSDEGSGIRCGDQRFAILFVSERFNRIEPRRFEGREEAEENSPARGEADAEREGPPRQRDREGRQPVDAEANGAAEEAPDQAAHPVTRHTPDQDLPEALSP